MRTSFKILLLIVVIFANSIPAFASKERSAELSDKFLMLQIEKKYDEAVLMLDSSIVSMIDAEKMKMLWEQTQNNYGNFKQFNGSTVNKYASYYIVETLLDFNLAFITARVVFNEAEKVAGFYLIPQKSDASFNVASYVKKDNFNEEKLQFGVSGWELPAALCLPNSEKKAPVVILLAGSGPQDMDQTYAVNKPFRDIAWGLATQGIATFRFDKRTKVHANKLSGEISDNFTLEEEYIQDALAAIEYLAMRQEIDKSKIYILGHSLGGTALPMVESKTNKLAGSIYLAAGARPMEDVIVEQLEYIASLNPNSQPEEDAAVNEMKRLAANVKLLDKQEFPADSLPFGVPASYWRYMANYSPTATFAKSDIPKFVLQGSRDYQVTLSDYNEWSKAGSKIKDKVKYKLYPKLNHLFFEGVGTATPAEYSKQKHVSEEVINDIVKWIND